MIIPRPEKFRQQKMSFLSSVLDFGIGFSSHLHHFILELGQEPIDNLVLLDGQRVQVDLFHALDLASLDETAQLGDRLPFLLLRLWTTTARSSSSTAVTAASVSSTPITETATSSGSSVSHVGLNAQVSDWRVALRR